MGVWNKESHWAKGLVNLNQSPEERREKYALCKSLGASPDQANRMRDWRMSKIKRRYKLI